MLRQLKPFLKKPALYEGSTSAFWNDAHISKGMLASHLDAGENAATRNHTFVDQSVNWIVSAFPPEEYPDLIDLGCGPGIYDEKFYAKNFHVTGVDISERSIRYASTHAAKKGLHIQYLQQDYLTLAYTGQFDLATMIYCDFGVLSDADRALLLSNIYRALKPHGAILFDVFTPNYYKNRPETKTWEYHETGFFSEENHISLQSFYRYPDCNTFLEQYIIVTADNMNCYNIWNHAFTTDELRRDLSAAGFSEIQFFSDVSGAAYRETSNTLCIIARK